MTSTRLEGAYSVTHPPKFLENAEKKNWKADIRVLRYLETTLGIEIIYIYTEGKIMVNAFTEAFTIMLLSV